MTLVLLVAGLLALVAGGEVLVRGAGGVATALGMSPLIVGLTVVAAATSAPELAVSLDASLSGSPGLALGNVVGSNIANVLLVLGVSALVLPLVVGLRLVRIDVPILILLSALTFLLALDGTISRTDGLLLVALAVGHLGYTVVAARRTPVVPEPAPAGATPPDSTGAADLGDAALRRAPRGLGRDVLLVVVGVVLLVVGAGWLVEGATAVAQALGVSDLVIGLTVVSIGTSLPELATSVLAVARGQRDVAVGNVVGSGILNLGMVLGLAAVTATDGVPVPPAALRFDLPVMVAVALALLPVAIRGMQISRPEGAAFVAYYAGYTGYLVLYASHHAALRPFSAVLFGFVVPLTVFWLVLLSVRLARRARHARQVPAAR